MPDIKKIADNADIIVNGYAFTKCENGYRVINLNRPEAAAVLSETNEVLETSMDDIELVIVLNCLQKNKKYMEDENA